jgi:enoyl-CoA hydratase/carnithine racemase
MAESTVLTNLDDEGVLTVTLNRPEKKNAFNKSQWLGLRDALNEAHENDAVTVIILTGAGKDFSAGVDLTDFGEEGDEPQPFDLFFDALLALDKPLLAAAKGVAVGIGSTVLFHCDIVYVGESIRLSFPFARLGLVMEAASSYLMQVCLGPQQAAELLFTSEWIDAKRVLETGIAARVYPDEDLLIKTQEKAHEIAQWPLNALREIKRCLKLHHRDGIKAAKAAEYAGMGKLVGTPENMEAITAFMEKRKPDFRKLKRA